MAAEPCQLTDLKTMIAVIAAAIKKRHAIEIGYKESQRRIEPCCLGESYDRRWLLWGWQVNRYSGWRIFNVEEFTEIRDTGEAFRSGRCGFDYSHPKMTLVHARITS